MKEQPGEKRLLLDRAGRSVVGYVLRKTRLEDSQWVGREVRFLRPGYESEGVDAHGSPVARYVVRRAQVLFVGSNQWHDTFRVFARPVSLERLEAVPLIKSLRTYSHQSWWLSRDEAGRPVLERRATLYEERMPELPPKSGWELAPVETVVELIGKSKTAKGRPLTHGSETERELREKEIVASRARSLSSARAALYRHERDHERLERDVARKREACERCRIKVLSLDGRLDRRR